MLKNPFCFYLKALSSYIALVGIAIMENGVKA